MVTRSWCGGLIALAIWGCAGESGDNGNGPRVPNGPNRGGLVAGAGGSGSASQGGGLFGNPNQMQPRPPMGGGGGAIAAGGMSGECEVGKFCAPTTPDGNCGSLRFESDVEVTRTPGNILVIFDQSGSMDQPWSSG